VILHQANRAGDSLGLLIGKARSLQALDELMRVERADHHPLSVASCAPEAQPAGD
jgi:hypothetical protein